VAIFIGKIVTSAPNNRLTPGANNRALWVQNSGVAIGFTGRVVAIGSWTGRNAGPGAMNKRWGLYAMYGAVPGLLLGATHVTAIAHGYSGDTGGANAQGVVDPNSILAGRRSRSGHIIIVPSDVLAYADADFTAGSRAAATALVGSTPKVHRMHSRTVANAAMPSPMQPALNENLDGYLAIYAIAEPNRAPALTVDALLNPVSTTPGSPVIVGRTDPELTVRFADADRSTGYNDFPSAIYFTAYRWTGTGWTNAGQAQYRVGVDYAQPADGTGTIDLTLRMRAGILQMGDTYRIHVLALDELGAASAAYANAAGYWQSQAELQVLPGGYVQDATPVGRITDLTPDLGGTYENEDGFASATIAVRLLRRGSNGLFAIVDTSAPIAQVVAIGDPFTITWAATGFDDLEPTTDYAVEYQVVDSNATIGPWYGRAEFHTNYRPLTPGNLRPTGGQPLTGAPLVTFTMTDPDDTPVALGGTLTAEVEVAGPYGINGTFEADAAGWSAGSTSAGITVNIGRQTDQFDTGVASYRLQATANSGAGGSSAAQTALMPVAEGYSYTVRARRRSTITTMVPLIGFAWYTAAGAFISASYSPAGTVVANTWQSIQLTATAPATATQVRLLMQSTIPAAVTGSNWWDNVVMDSGVRIVQAASMVAGTTGNWQAQLVISPTLAVAGTYTLRARGRDGNLDGDWSSASSIIMLVGPTVNVLVPTPAQVFTTHRPTIEWEVVGTQTRYRVLVYEADGITLKPNGDSGWVTNSATRAWIPPAGVLGADTEAVVQVQVDSSGAIGYSTPVPFTVDYPLPAPPANLHVSYAMLPGDDFATVIQLDWDPFDTAPDNLRAVEVRRQGPDGTIEQLGFFVGFDPGTFIDHRPLSGVQYRYLVRQHEVQGTEERAGEDGAVDAQLTLYGAVLHELNDPENERVSVQWWTARNVRLTSQQSFSVPAGGTDYVEARGLLAGRDLDVEWQLADAADYGGESGVVAVDNRNRLERMHDRGGLLYWRDGTGRGMACVFNGEPDTEDVNRGVVKFRSRFQLRRVAVPEADL
jgi:hypothetical protein